MQTNLAIVPCVSIEESLKLSFLVYSFYLELNRIHTISRSQTVMSCIMDSTHLMLPMLINLYRGLSIIMWRRVGIGTLSTSLYCVTCRCVLSLINYLDIWPIHNVENKISFSTISCGSILDWSTTKCWGYTTKIGTRSRMCMIFESFKTSFLLGVYIVWIRSLIVD